MTIRINKILILKLLAALSLLPANAPAQYIDPRADYFIKPAADRRKLLTAGLPETGNPESVFLSSAAAPANAKMWKFEQVHANTYLLKNVQTGRYLTAPAHSTVHGTVLGLWPDVGSSATVWELIRYGSTSGGYTYKFKNTGADLYLSIVGGTPAEGVRLMQARDEGQPSLNWRLEESSGTVPLVDLSEEAAPTGIRTHDDGSIDILKERWQPLFTQALSVFKVDINNYTERANEFVRGDTYKYDKPNDNYMRFGSKIKQAFSMRHFRMDPATIYFINLTNNPPVVGTSGQQGIMLRMTYQTRPGNEILANCINNIACGGGMWWINLMTMELIITLTPALEGGMFTYTNATVSARGRVSSDGSNVIVENFNNRSLFNMLAGQIQAALNTAEMKSFFKNQLNAAIVDASQKLFPGETSSTSSRRNPVFMPFNNVSITASGDLHFTR